MATAQAPAKVAPKTSAAIKIAADSTVETCSQLMRRGRPWAGSFMGRNLDERGRRIKSAETRRNPHPSLLSSRPSDPGLEPGEREPEPMYPGVQESNSIKNTWVPGSRAFALGRDDTQNFGGANARKSAPRPQAHARSDVAEPEARRVFQVHAGRQTNDDFFGDLLKSGAEVGGAFQPDDGARVQVDPEMREGFAMDRLLADRGDEDLDPALRQQRGRPHRRLRGAQHRRGALEAAVAERG